MTYQLHHGDMLDILPMMERDSIDAIVTDPPYGLVEPRSGASGYSPRTEDQKAARRGGFMGKLWDHGVPDERMWREAYRVAKPGAHLLAFGGTRTFHRLACAIEDAGWEIRDCVMWVYGSGFPKSHDVSKAIDREAGAEREVIGHKPKVGGGRATHNQHEGYQRPWMDEPGAKEKIWEISEPATPAAREWDGWGTALKPAWEPIIVARKPLAGTVAENVQRYGTGAINVDGCRVETEARPLREHTGRDGNIYGSGLEGSKAIGTTSQGRWPANLILTIPEDEYIMRHDIAAGSIHLRPARAP